MSAIAARHKWSRNAPARVWRVPASDPADPSDAEAR